MFRISTSRALRSHGPAGFTAVELLIGLVIAGCLAGALVPVWISLLRAGESESDRGIWYLQSRVALARFERDLRVSGAAGCRFSVAGSVLEATPSQVVLFCKAEGVSVPVIVEWEIVKGSLMRRWGPCPEVMPRSFPHSLYADSKTMLENLAGGSSLRYSRGDAQLKVPMDPGDLVLIDSVRLELTGGSSAKSGEIGVSTVARVGW